MSEISAYPLSWPVGWPRTQGHLRERGVFEGTPDKVRRELVRGAERMILGPDSRIYTARHMIVLSSNVPLRQDGEPMGTRSEPTGPGVAIYFERNKKKVCLACDKYDRVWKNMRALLKTIEALRGIERWGSSQLLERAFEGFLALPQKTGDSWQDVLGITSSQPTIEEIKTAFRAKANIYHPDKNPEGEAEYYKITAAYENACAWWEANH